MARLTTADVARQLGLSRTTLDTLSDQGLRRAIPGGSIDTAEPGCVMCTTHIDHERPRPPGAGVKRGKERKAVQSAMCGMKYRELTKPKE
jgi:hypothetical protein